MNRQLFAGADDITNKPLKTKSFLLFNFSITNICVAIRLAEDETRIGGIYFQLSPSIVGVRYFVFVLTYHFSIKPWLQLLTKKCPSRELLSFKSSIYKEKCGTVTKRDSVRETLSVNIYFEKILEVEALFWTFRIRIIVILWR